jgi:hypothetical protein
MTLVVLRHMESMDFLGLGSFDFENANAVFIYVHQSIPYV